MRVVVTSVGDTLDAEVSPVFGRCRYFVFVDTETMQYDALANPARDASGGAGIQAAQHVIQRDPEAVVSGNVGPNAMQVLSAAELPVYVASGSTVRQAVEELRKGRLQSANAPTVGADFGKPGTMAGRGLGQGLGLGAGGGRASEEGRAGRLRGNRPGAGPGGQCVCPQCGHAAAHQVGQPCYQVKCPQCGTPMVRQ